MWYFDSVHYERRDADLRQLSPNVNRCTPERATATAIEIA